MKYNIFYQIYGYPNSRELLATHDSIDEAKASFDNLLQVNSISHQIEVTYFPMPVAKLTDVDGYCKIIWIVESA